MGAVPQAWTGRLPRAVRRLGSTQAGAAWLSDLPGRVAAAAEAWSLTLGPPYPGSSVSLALPATDGAGRAVVLKIQYPHRESTWEAEALRRWGGSGAVGVFDTMESIHALLLERCVPGTYLADDQDVDALEIAAGLLPMLWRADPIGFPKLEDEVGVWRASLGNLPGGVADRLGRRLIDAAIDFMASLASSQGAAVLAHQDLHGHNILRATRLPWLVIDPKPLAAEREFAVAPLVRSREFGHSRAAVVRRLDFLAERLGLDRERVRQWTVAQTVSWAYEGTAVLDDHLDTARWLLASGRPR